MNVTDLPDCDSFSPETLTSDVKIKKGYQRKQSADPNQEINSILISAVVFVVMLK